MGAGTLYHKIAAQGGFDAFGVILLLLQVCSRTLICAVYAGFRRNTSANV